MKEINAIDTVKGIIKSLENNLAYCDVENDLQKITSYRNYNFSRYFDKISTLGINYIRLSNMIPMVKFPDARCLVEDEKQNEKYLYESDVELITSVLRPLFELFLELKSIKITIDKFGSDREVILEDVSQLIYNNQITTDNQMKLGVCRDFYDCEPKYLKLWGELNNKEMSSWKQKFSIAEIPVLKSIRNKMPDVVKSMDTNERLFFGQDYLTFYAMLSKKSHFSYSNIIVEQFPTNVLLHWCLAFFLSIYFQIMDFLNAEDEFKKEVSPAFELLNSKIDMDKINMVPVGNYAIFDWGIAEVKEKKNLNLVVSYVASNAFEVGEQDEIPRIFVKKDVDKATFDRIHKEYYNAPKVKYDDDNYAPFYLELMKV